MRTYYCGIALALLVLLSAGQASCATYELFILWDEQPQEVYAGQTATFDLILALSSTGAPQTTEPGPGPSTSTPTSVPPYPTPPPTPPTGESSLSLSGIGGIGSGMSMSLAGTVKVTSTTSGLLSGWTAKIYDDIIYLEDGESEEVMVKISVPDEATPGSYTVLFTAKGQGTNEVTAELVVIVKEPYDLYLSNMTLSPSQPTIGDTVTFSADATLIGDVVITDKIVALYINEISQSKIGDTTVSLLPNETKTVSVQWVASSTGSFNARLYANPSKGDQPVTNNEVMRSFSVSEATDPCATALAVYNEALALYDDNCVDAIAKLTVAQTLYQQCGDTEGAAQCQMLIDKCNQYTLAQDFESQGDSFAELGDCENAILKWTSALEIYQLYDDQDRVDALQYKIDNCDSSRDDGSFIANNWWWILLLIILIAAAIIFFATKRREEEEEEPEPTMAPLMPPEAGTVVTAETKPKAAGVIPPLVIPREEDKDIPADVRELIGAIDRALAYYTKDVISRNMKKSVDAYAKMVDTRNEMSAKMDDSTRMRVDQMIKVLEDRIFDTL